MNATIEDLRVRLEKESYLSVISGFAGETHPYTLISNRPNLRIDITAEQARHLCDNLLAYFPDVIEEAKEEAQDAIGKAS